MKRSIRSAFLAFVALTALSSGCSFAPTPVPLASAPIPTNRPMPTMPPPPLFQDDFSTNSENRNWEKHGPWKIQEGAFLIDISGADLPWAAAFTYPLGDTRERNNVSIEVDNMCESGGYYSAISLRQTEKGAYFFRLFWNDQSTEKFVSFGRNDGSGGKEATLRSPGFDLAYNHWYHLKVTAVGNHFWSYIDDQLVMEYIDTQDPLLYGGVALGVYSPKEEIRCFFDNVKIINENK